MNKLHLLKSAEQLYCIENLNADKIAEELNISRRTVFNWIKKYNWKSNPVRIKDFPKTVFWRILFTWRKIIQKND